MNRNASEDRNPGTTRPPPTLRSQRPMGKRSECSLRGNGGSTYVDRELEVAVRVESAEVGEVRLWGGRISKDARSDGRRVYYCQAVGINLTILDDLGVNESGAQTKGEKSKNKSVFDHHPNGGRGKREMIPGFSVSAVCDRVCQPTVVVCCWVARSTSDSGLLSWNVL